MDTKVGHVACSYCCFGTLHFFVGHFNCRLMLLFWQFLFSQLLSLLLWLPKKFIACWCNSMSRKELDTVAPDFDPRTDLHLLFTPGTHSLFWIWSGTLHDWWQNPPSWLLHGSKRCIVNVRCMPSSMPKLYHVNQIFVYGCQRVLKLGIWTLLAHVNSYVES